MSKTSAHSLIRLRGVRQNNLKNIDLDLPLGQLIVVTGLSGSGKSSLAFDTLFAEGQRRYIETFSPYARQFFDRMDKPRVDSVEGIPPAIAIEQRNAVKSTRSTVGTMTEICDQMKVLWPHIAQLRCRQCGRPVRKDSPQTVWQTLSVAGESGEGKEFLITFDVPLSDKISMEESFALISKQGYQRIWLAGEVVRLEDAASRIGDPVPRPASLTIVQDRIRSATASRARFVEACDQAYHFGKGKLTVHELAVGAGNPDLKTAGAKRFSNRLHCADCDLEYREPSTALFSFNHPVGACAACKGFGRTITIDYDLAVPDRSLTLAGGAVRPWRGGFSAECQTDLAKFCKKLRVPMNVPFADLSAEHQRWVLEGDLEYGKDADHQWPRSWYGVKGYFRWLESKSYKMHVRVLLSRYRAYTTCATCQGTRFQPEALLYTVPMAESRRGDIGQNGKPSAAGSTPSARQLTLADFYALPVRDSLNWVESLAESRRARHPARTDPVATVLGEVRARLAYLDQVGLGYLALDRSTRSLSGGETERVNLTTCLGTRLVNTLFVLDEPSVGLHPRDTERLVGILEHLRDAGNTVVVVEHEAAVMRAADEIVDVGPGHGAAGGQVVFQGSYSDILKSSASLTGQYLSGRRKIDVPERRPVAAGLRRPGFSSKPQVGKLKIRRSRLAAGTPQGWLKIENATRHNLRQLNVEIPLGRLVCLTGVSGSGKTTLVREVLLPALEANLNSQSSHSNGATPKASDRIEEEKENEAEPTAINDRRSTSLQGHEHIGRVVLVDQSALGKTPRSNPAVYIGAFEEIREVFAQSDTAKQRGLTASSFSFNSAQGQCERCRGAGFEKIEMQFLSDVFIRCPDCDGRRYRSHILEVAIRRRGNVADSGKKTRGQNQAPAVAEEWCIADALEATVDEAIDFLATFAESNAAKRAVERLKWLQEVGLGYLQLGQPINTLSGGESQRLKLVSHLAEANNSMAAEAGGRASDSNSGFPRAPSDSGLPRPAATLFLFDEPTTGLHFEDVRVLLKVFQRLVDAGHSAIVIEHNLDVIKCADWVIDLGPEAGDLGGRIVAQGTPEDVARSECSVTGQHLKAVLKPRREVPCS